MGPKGLSGTSRISTSFWVGGDREERAFLQPALALQQFVQPLVQALETGPDRQGVVDVDRALLPDPVYPVRGLVLPGRVPVAGEVDHVVGLDDGQADSGRQRREDQDREPLRAREALQDLPARAGGGAGACCQDFAVDHADGNP